MLFVIRSYHLILCMEGNTHSSHVTSKSNSFGKQVKVFLHKIAHTTTTITHS